MAAGLLTASCGGGAGGGTGSSGGSGPTTPTPTPVTPPPVPAAKLNAIAVTKKMRFGSTIGGRRNPPISTLGDGSYRSLVAQQCGLIVPENELKWQTISPDARTVDFSAADDMLAFATENGLAMRGHNLIWHQDRWLPSWLASYDFGPDVAAGTRQLIIDHVTGVVGHYGSKITSWDVVNEAVDPGTGLLYQTRLSRNLGSPEAVIDLAFTTARAVAPAGTQLVYNDYAGWEAGNDAHRAGVLRLLTGMKARGVPIDAYGVQSHLGIYSIDPATGTGRYEEGPWRAFLDGIVALGLDLIITELDVRDDALPGDVAVRDDAVAKYVRAYLDLMFGYKQLRDVLVWGMVDPYSWLQSIPRSDGAARRPNPYDGAYQAKPMQTAIGDAFTATSARS
jgi:endo-1,4-beta-xylanase